MDNVPFPEDLGLFEELLAGRPRVEAPADLRDRIVATITNARTASRGGLREILGWPGAVAAAAVLLWVNFSTSVINDMDWPLGAGLERVTIERATGSIKLLQPDLSPREAFRQALLMQAASQIAPAADPRLSLEEMLGAGDRKRS